VKGLAAIVIGGMSIASAATAAAQTAAQTAASSRADVQSRYQIGQLERVLEGAVEHGATIVRDRLQALVQMPTDLLAGDNAHARGFRLEGYGVFFDVIVPSFQTETTLWSMRTLDQNDLGLDSAIKALQAAVKNSGDVNLEQALRRVELQVSPSTVDRRLTPVSSGTREAAGSTASAGDPPAAPDPILADPNEAYRAEVIQALKDAMLDHSSSLAIGPGEWLTIAAKGNDDRPRLAPADSDARTRIIRLKGADLAAYLARQITRDEALQRIEVRVF
jgi:hypothetical protein